MRESTALTVGGLNTRSAVNGLTPPLASVAAATATCLHVTLVEHAWKYSSSVELMSVPRGNACASRIMYARQKLRSAVSRSDRNVAASTCTFSHVRRRHVSSMNSMRADLAFLFCTPTAPSARP